MASALRLRTFQLIAGAGLLGLPVPVFAGSSVTPLAVDVSSQHPMGQVTFWNGGTTPVTVQASVLRWQLRDGADAYEDAPEVLVAPAIVEIQPGSGQLFRVRLKGPLPSQEQAYRLVLQDITPVEENQGVQMRVKHDLPLTFVPAGATPHLVAAPCEPLAPANCVRIRNDGTHLARVSGITFEGDDWRHDTPTSSTILAGGWRQFSLNLPRSQPRARKITVHSPAGDITLLQPLGD